MNNRKFARNGGKGKYKLPDRWNKYTTMGNIVPGTRFLPFKTPLKEEICKRSLSQSNWFTPAMLLEKAPNLKLIIDLTQTDRFYSTEDFVKNGVRHKKILCPGGGKQLPPQHIIQEFNRAIDSFLQSEDALDGGALIGVHCTHGLNRTGYLICKYMVQRNGVPADKAIEDFQTARGHKMERDLYVNDILGKVMESKTLSYSRSDLDEVDSSSSYRNSQRSSFEHDRLLDRSSYAYRHVKRYGNHPCNNRSYHPYRDRIDSRYNRNISQSRYTDRDMFYPSFNKN